MIRRQLVSLIAVVLVVAGCREAVPTGLHANALRSLSNAGGDTPASISSLTSPAPGVVLASFAAVADIKAYNLKISPTGAPAVHHVTDVVGTGSATWSGLAAGTYTVCIKVEGVGGPFGGCASVTIAGSSLPSQTIVFPPIANKTYGDAAFTVTATGGASGNPILWTADGNCTVDENGKVTFTGAGSCTVTASQAGNASYAAATSVSQTFTIAKAAVTATAGSYAGVYDGTSHDLSSCTISGAFTGDLTCTNSASSAGPNVGSSDVTPIVSGTGLAANFEVSAVVGHIAITPASVSVQAGSGSAVYSGALLVPSSCQISGPTQVGISCSNSPAQFGPDAGTTTVQPVVTGSLDNYNIVSTGTGTLTIEKAPSLVTVTCAAQTYNGAPFTPCTAVATGAGDLSVPLTVTYSDNVNAGTASATASYSGDANHDGSTGAANFTINKASSTTTVTCDGPHTYNGSAFDTCSAVATGANNLSVPVTVTYGGTNVGAGTATASASYEGDANHDGSNGSETFTINKAVSSLTASCGGPYVYTGSAQTPCTATVVGDGVISSSATISYDNNNVNAGTASATASWVGDDNHTAAADVALTFEINKAASTTTVTCDGPQTYTGAAINTCSAVATGAGNLSVSITPTFSSNVNAGTASATAVYDGDANHDGSSGASSFTINKANTSIAISCPVSQTYTGAAQTPCTATVAGANLSIDLTASLAYSDNKNAGTATTSVSYGGDANHFGSTGSANFTINPAPLVVTPFSGSRTFGQANPTACSVTGAVGTESFTCVSSSTANATSLVGSSNPTSGTINPSAFSLSNYSITYNTGALTITAYVQAACYMAPLYSVMPSTKAYQKKGSVLPIKCQLTDDRGVNISNASGDLTITDLTVTKAPLTVLNAFKYTLSLYMNQQDTSNSFYELNHQYKVSTKWADGSTSTGYFYVALR